VGHFLCAKPIKMFVLTHPVYITHPLMKPFGLLIWQAQLANTNIAPYNDSITILPPLLKRESNYGNERGESTHTNNPVIGYCQP